MNAALPLKIRIDNDFPIERRGKNIFDEVVPKRFQLVEQMFGTRES